MIHAICGWRVGQAHERNVLCGPQFVVTSWVLGLQQPPALLQLFQCRGALQQLAQVGRALRPPLQCLPVCQPQTDDLQVPMLFKILNMAAGEKPFSCSLEPCLLLCVLAISKCRSNVDGIKRRSQDSWTLLCTKDRRRSKALRNADSVLQKGRKVSRT